MKNKVLAYITRQHHSRPQLLVFEHRDYPEAGLQVPAGTVEPDEDIEAALFREIHEESGLADSDLKLIRKLAEFEEVEWRQLRHTFHLMLMADKPQAESWVHIVHGKGEDVGLAFAYRWIDLPAEVELSGEQGKWLYLIAR